MSLLSLQKAMAGKELSQAEMFEITRREMAMTQDMYNRMVNSCWNKCVTRFNDSDVTEGEGSCTDRCVKKYFEVQGRVGKVLNGIQERQMQQAGQ